MKGTREPVPTKKDAVSYVRVASGLDEADERRQLADQRISCHHRARSLGAAIVGEFKDTGSTRSADRPGLQAMLRHVRRGGIDFVVVANPDRLSRSAAEYDRIKTIVERTGAALVDGSSSSGPAAERLRQALLKSFAEFARDLRRRYRAHPTTGPRRQHEARRRVSQSLDR
jgi:DNA invertase Pin-like site-specific DNA recombinase